MLNKSNIFDGLTVMISACQAIASAGDRGSTPRQRGRRKEIRKRIPISFQNILLEFMSPGKPWSTKLFFFGVFSYMVLFWFFRAMSSEKDAVIATNQDSGLSSRRKPTCAF